VLKQNAETALAKASQDFIIYPQSTFFLIAPWLAMAWLIFKSRHERRKLRCLLPYFLASVTITYLYVDAQLAAAAYLQRQMWTAAALATGFPIFYAIGLVTIAALISRFMSRSAS
jgi:hypothetical protein